ncbi:MAG: adenosylcobinamide-GDP ribazoletransferase [Candidatus Orphnella occulta]|nr:adenosylcobinamide-GDP ribazoletransferase [Candidatus Orphnella occulta]MDP8297609.1 adenosylcobinamide-GDP ribazoletransferase [Candidatus Orphnella occulta]
MSYLLDAIKGFLLAIGFLTIIPVKSNWRFDNKISATMLLFFPVAGLVIGFLLAGTNIFLSFFLLNRFLINSILIILLIVITGSLHLDGLADTFDGFLSRKNRADILKVMKDSHIGTMGALSLICIILIKLALLSALRTDCISSALILMVCLSRYYLVFLIFCFPYAREEGKAKIFFDSMNRRIFLLATVVTLFLSYSILNIKGLIIFALLMPIIFLFGSFIKNKIGGMTGDTLGAINEFCEVAILFMCLIFYKI